MSPLLRLDTLRRPWAVWWTLCVALFFTAAPSLTHAAAFARNNAFPSLEICTSQGAKTGAPDSAAAHAHCPFCLHSADRVAPPPHPMPYLFLVQGGQQEGPAWQAFFFFSHLYLRAAPRGPPAIS